MLQMGSPHKGPVIENEFRWHDPMTSQVIRGRYTFIAKLNMTGLGRNSEWQSTESLGTGTAKCLWHARINLLAYILRTTYSFSFFNGNLFVLSLKIWFILFISPPSQLLLPEQMKAEFPCANAFNQWFWKKNDTGSRIDENWTLI